MPAAPSPPPPEPTPQHGADEAQPRRLRDLDGYPRRLFALLVLATFFEGFDTKLAGLVLSPVGLEFGADQSAMFGALAFANLGMVVAVLSVRSADRFGRRPVLLVAIAAYAAFTLGTAFAPDLAWFTALQLGAKLAMVTELAIAFLLLSEELPPALRGRANGLLGAFATVGAAVPAFFLPLLGWRGLFVAGSAPLLLLPLFWTRIRESSLWSARVGPEGSGTERRSWADEWRAVRSLIGPAHRTRFVAMTLLWFTVNFWAACTVGSFAYYVFEERSWTPEALQWLVPAAVPFSFAGYALSGLAMDRIGRRPTAALFLALGALAGWICFRASDDRVIGAAYIAIQMLNGLWPVAQTLVAELFPTELRADANAMSHNLLGRWGMVAGPAAVAWLAAGFGSTGAAVGTLVLLNLACIPVVWIALPETRGLDLRQAGGAAQRAWRD